MKVNPLWLLLAAFASLTIAITAVAVFFARPRPCAFGKPNGTQQLQRHTQPEAAAEEDSRSNDPEALSKQLHDLSCTAVTQSDRAAFKAKLQSLIARGAQVGALPSKEGDGSMHMAAMYGSPTTVEVLLELGADVNQRSRAGATPLHYAVQVDKLDNCRVLLDHGADPLSTSDKVDSPLQVALQARRPNPEIIKLLKQHVKGEMSLPAAVAAGNTEAVKRALARGENVEQVDAQGRSVLCIAAENGQAEICTLLLDAGASPHTPIPIGGGRSTTILAAAARRGNAAVVKLLIARSGTIDPKELGEPLVLAAGRGDVATCRALLTSPIPTEAQHKAFEMSLLVGQGGVVDLFLEKGQTLPLWGAARLNRIEAIQQLLAAGTDVEEKCPEGRTALSYAAYNGNTAVMELLLAKGADVEAKSKFVSTTPLGFAAAGGHLAAVKLLLTKGAKINVLNASGYSPLHSAVKNGHYEVAEALLKHGADPNFRASVGRGPSTLSLARDNPEMTALLVKYGAKEVQ